jgi:hypothetical protein
MNPFEFVIAILFLSFVFKLVSSALQHRNQQQRGDAAADVANTELRQRLEQMEERVRVLERIVTDERFDLKQQFKEL